MGRLDDLGRDSLDRNDQVSIVRPDLNSLRKGEKTLTESGPCQGYEIIAVVVVASQAPMDPKSHVPRFCFTFSLIFLHSRRHAYAIIMLDSCVLFIGLDGWI